ncbi:hypothetical protein THRCLA_03583 [Thraustotheca clavata]|uniref:Monopolin complex subunit Csm1/Pcs1 C-terminal domain-containing protein n=1 Tax=Thraustotheca clavata TaxID=74557 RepID=A0A1W0A1N2_9STRA|nr:hypothetical protein THRCLA_03583 [Thraustotheca clavata]
MSRVKSKAWGDGSSSDDGSEFEQKKGGKNEKVVVKLKSVLDGGSKKKRIQETVEMKPVKKAKLSTSKVNSFTSVVEKMLMTYDESKDMKKLKKDYEEIWNVRQTQPEKLLEEARKLMKSEADAHDKTMMKMKQDIANLNKKLGKYEKMREDLERAKEKNGSSSELTELKQQYDQLHAENVSLRLQLEETQQTTPATNSNASTNEMHAKLAHTNKLLRIYELLTSLHISLKKDGKTDVQEVSCRAVDSLRAQQFAFDLSIPTNPRKQIDYIPSSEEVEYHTRQSEPTAPPYLLEELSFSRTELTRFMRTILDAVIRKPT